MAGHVLALTTYGLAAEFSLRATWCGQYGRGVIATVMSVLVLANLGMTLNVTAAVTGLIFGSVAVMDGYATKGRILFACGLLNILGSLAWMIYHAYLFFDFGNWAVLAVGGMATILVASTIERHGIAIKSKLSLVGQRFTEPT